jgi:hypothetical protein
MRRRPAWPAALGHVVAVGSTDVDVVTQCSSDK